VEIQPIVIGTAGHIDHGKSTLVRSLTGIDPDRLKEEKERGLTIDLGFARMELADGRQVGIVDVPGHERFIKNMVAGATGMDLVILVVAADDGVMPQTREHLAIMSILGIKRGFIALTKVDLVEPDLVDLAEEDVRESVAGTFLEDAPIVRVAPPAGQGVEELRALLSKLAQTIEPRSDDGVFRMPVQRVFSSRGFGTIVTGIPMSGRVSVGDVLEVLPSGQKGKVRGIQAYHQSTQTARAGHSTALNLADVDHSRVERGDVVCSKGFFRPIKMVGASLAVLPDFARNVVNRLPIRLHAGTAEALGEVVLLDHEELEPGSEGFVQFRLEHALVCAPGDRFVVRLASPMVTIGGGTILEESKYRLKRFKRFVLDDLERQAASLGSPVALLEAELVRAPERWVPVDALAFKLKRPAKDTRALLAELEASGRALSPGPGERWIHREVFDLAVQSVQDQIEGWFRDNPLRQVVDVLDVRRLTGFDANFLAVLLTELEQRGVVLNEAGGNVRMAGREIELDDATRELRATLLELLEGAGVQPPAPDELCARVGAAQADVERVLKLLEDEGKAGRVGAIYYATAVLDQVRTAIVENCEANGKLEIPELRDRLGTTRKFLIPLLEYFDAKGVTLRQGGHRVLKRR